MKARWIAALALGFCCGIPAVASAAALESACDVNQDGVVSAADAAVVAAAIGGGSCGLACDVNGDGKLSEGDTEVVAADLLGIEACPLTGASAADLLWESQGTKALVYVRDGSGMTMYFVTTIDAPPTGLRLKNEAVAIDTTGNGRPDAVNDLPMAMRPPVSVSMPGQPSALLLTFTHPGYLRWRKPVGTATAKPVIALDLDGDGMADAALRTTGAYGW